MDEKLIDSSEMFAYQYDSGDLIELLNSKPIHTREDQYLFQAVSSSLDFLKISDQMAALNDYFIIIFQATQETLNHSQNRLETFDARDRDELESMVGGGFTKDEIMMSVEEDVFKYEWLNGFVAKANALLLIYILVEKSLKELCNTYAASTPESYNFNEDPALKDKSTIGRHIHQLSKFGGITIHESNEFVDVKNRIDKATSLL